MGHAVLGGHPAMETPTSPTNVPHHLTKMRAFRFRNHRTNNNDDDGAKGVVEIHDSCFPPRGGALTRRNRNLLGIIVAIVVVPSVAVPAVRIGAGIVLVAAVLDTFDLFQ